MSRNEWWRGAAIYQIYPRSFQDSNGDGVGDLRGALRRLPYVASLGVDAIWISPFFKSPMRDFGYDVADYRAVDPIFGTNADFARLISAAHERDLKIIIDLVLAHTSDQHAWFRESRQNSANPKADWYVWADPKPDGTPPNNWLSVFGGSAWQWDTRRRQYYLHHYLRSQPNLNWHNPQVVDAMFGEINYWLEAGIDGFRLDAITTLVHDRDLRDNPVRAVDPDAPPRFADANNPFTWQDLIYTRDQPRTLELLGQLLATHVWHRYIGEQQIDGLLALTGQAQSFGARTGGQHLVALTLQHTLHQDAHALVVLDEQHRGLAGRRRHAGDGRREESRRGCHRGQIDGEGAALVRGADHVDAAV